MDWLDEKLELVNIWLRNLSLRKALIVYIAISILAVVASYAITASLCDKYENIIWSRYYEEEQGVFNVTVYAFDYSILSGTDKLMVRAITNIRTWSILLYSVGALLGVSLLFYNNKLRQPLQLLKTAAAQVGANNLDIEMDYSSKDEMGELCRSFDFMRKQLMINNQNMWDMMEEQKRLNAAFAHDLRTPLTVLRGYTDFLSKYIPEGKISEEKLLATLSMMSEHIERLERYSNTMKQIHSFEELIPRPAHIPWHKLREQVQEFIRIMDGSNGIQIGLDAPDPEASKELFLDEGLCMEVLENLVSNALRYAESKLMVHLMIFDQDHRLMLSVEDDGRGFEPKELLMAAKPYYTNAEDKNNHFGIGLYISRLLCEKHGGWLTLSNNIHKGAIVAASFSVKEPINNLNSSKTF